MSRKVNWCIYMHSYSGAREALRFFAELSASTGSTSSPNSGGKIDENFLYNIFTESNAYKDGKAELNGAVFRHVQYSVSGTKCAGVCVGIKEFLQYKYHWSLMWYFCIHQNRCMCWKCSKLTRTSILRPIGNRPRLFRSKLSLSLPPPPSLSLSVSVSVPLSLSLSFCLSLCLCLCRFLSLSHTIEQIFIIIGPVIGGFFLFQSLVSAPTQYMISQVSYQAGVL